MATSSRHRASARFSRKGGGRELVAAASGAVLLVVIAVLSAWAHHSLSSVRPASPHAAAAQPASSVCPPLPPLPMGTQVRAWLTDAKPSIILLFGAADNLVTAARLGDVARTGAACQTAAGAVANLQHHMPSPDPALNTELQQAITSYQVGIRHCVSGTQKQGPIEIGEATVYINQGSTDLQAAVGIIEDDLSSDARDHRVWTA
jgi:hypothetical protein